MRHYIESFNNEISEYIKKDSENKLNKKDVFRSKNNSAETKIQNNKKNNISNANMLSGDNAPAVHNVTDADKDNISTVDNMSIIGNEHAIDNGHAADDISAADNVRIGNNYYSADNTPTVKKKGKALKDKEKIIKLTENLKEEAIKILNKNKMLLKDIEEFSSKLEKTEKEKGALISKLFEAENVNIKLQNEIEIMDQKINDLEEEIMQLKYRLQESFGADKLTQNQILKSFKMEIAKSLKAFYMDYEKLSSNEPSLDYYEGLLFVLERIFDVLNKKGIILGGKGV